MTSCIPATTGSSLAIATIPVTTEELPQLVEATAAPLPGAPSVLAGDPAVMANAALPVAGLPNPAATGFVFRASSGIDQMRAFDCLAQAIYYEARSEGEEGQRAVAQVVLNRVRHPAWPSTVCGVVYQGPMRAGGGCQFTFTCDGSLAVRPSGPSWTRAQRIAIAALAGETYAPVGHSTHYHTHAVFPTWAPRLVKTAVIGAHNFYRLPGGNGGPAAFTASYAGREPVPVPRQLFFREANGAAARPADGLAALVPQPSYQPAPAPAAAPLPVADVVSAPPPSTIREEYQASGQWRADAPAAITGR